MTKAVDLLRHIQRLALPDGDLLQLEVEEKILVRELGKPLTEQVELSKCGIERLQHLRKRHTLVRAAGGDSSARGVPWGCRERLTWLTAPPGLS